MSSHNKMAFRKKANNDHSHSTGRQSSSFLCATGESTSVDCYLSSFSQKRSSRGDDRRQSESVVTQTQKPSSANHLDGAAADAEAERRAISLDASSVSRKGKENILCLEHVDIKSVFRFGGEIGDGASGIVRKCHSRGSGDTLACKTISKTSLKSQLDIEDLKSEVETLRMMQKHPAVVRLRGVFEDSSRVHLVMECCEGGDLFTRIKERKFFTEPEAAMVCSSVASVLAFAHSHGIMHRDLKPENILLASKYSDTDIRVADFGSAAFFKPGQKLNQLVGSPLYIAPSVLQCRYGTEADMWSLGVVLYILLSGEPPFWGGNNAEIFRAVQCGQLSMERRRWKHVSSAAKELVRKLLTRDASRALTAQQVLDDPWIRSHCREQKSSAVASVNPAKRKFKPSEWSGESMPAGSASSSERRPGQHMRGSSDGMNELWMAEGLQSAAESSMSVSERSVLSRSAVPSMVESYIVKYIEGEDDDEDEDEEDIPIADVVPSAMVARQRNGHSERRKSCKEDGSHCCLWGQGSFIAL